MASTGEVWKLGHRPALDGVRGVAAVTVVAAHAHLPIGGGVAVNLFFALSGFLITSLLLEEHATRGTIRLGAFYLRRARRLMPALYVLVGAVMLVGAMFGFGAWWADPGAYAAAALYVSNWFSARGVTSALGHTWSLAVEEQFYLTWPLVLLLCARRSVQLVLWVAVALAVLSTLWLFVLVAAGAPFWRIGFGGDARVAPLLAGCALAAWMRGRAEGTAQPRLVVAGLASLAGLSFVPSAWSTPASAVASAGLLWAACQGKGFPALGSQVMRWLGARSYGLYLWHYPVALLSDRLAPDLASPGRFAVVLTVALLVADLSWRFIERPFLPNPPIGRPCLVRIEGDAFDAHRTGDAAHV